MSVPKLTYFGVSGRAEFIKILYEEKNEKYTVDTVAYPLKPEVGAAYPYGQLPILEDPDFGTLAQTQTIVRAVAKKLGLYPSNCRDAARAEMVSEGAMDLLGKYFALHFAKNLSKEDFLKACKTWFGYFETQLKQNKGGKEFVCHSEFSFADLQLFQIVDVVVESCAKSVLDGFPVLKDFHHRIAVRPNIAAFLASDRRLHGIAV